MLRISHLKADYKLSIVQLFGWSICSVEALSETTVKTSQLLSQISLWSSAKNISYHRSSLHRLALIGSHVHFEIAHVLLSFATFCVNYRQDCQENQSLSCLKYLL